MSATPELVNGDSSPRPGLAYLPLELLRKIVQELHLRTDLAAFALVCRSTTLPAREALFDTLTLSDRLGPESFRLGKTRLSPFPTLVRRLVLYRVSLLGQVPCETCRLTHLLGPRSNVQEEEMLNLSPVDLAVVLHNLPNVRSLDVSGQITVSMPQVQSAFHSCFRMIDSLAFRPSAQDYAHESLRVLLDHCRNLTHLDLGTELVTLEDPVTPWRFAPRRLVPIPASLELPNLRRLTLRSPLYLSLSSLDLVSPVSLQRIRTVELDFTEESVGRTWKSGSMFPRDFFASFGAPSSSSIEHVSFNFPLYSKRSNVETLEHALADLSSLRSVELGSIASGAASVLVGLPPTCRDISIVSADGSPDWMSLHRFFLEHDGDPALDELSGRRIRMDPSDCTFCDENFQRETEVRCARLGIELIVPDGPGRGRAANIDQGV
ncbi:hypothetical protein JCM11491_002553 [Sporobolomyces phaffii]